MADLISTLSKKYGVPEWLVRNMLQQESGNRQVDTRGRVITSPAGAQGAAQLMPGTARALEARYPGLDTSTYAGNVEGGIAYLSEQLKRFGRPDLALSAYNSGPGGSESSGRVESFRETQDYVRKILGGGGGGGSPSPAVMSPAPPAAGPSPAVAPPTPRISRGQFASSLVAALQQPQDSRTNALLGAVLALKQDRDRMRGEAAAQPQVQAPPPLDFQAAGMTPFSRENAPDQRGFVPEFGQAVSALLRDVPGLSVTSGYRSPERQAELFKAAVAKYGSESAARKWVAPPGSSKHNHGVAADLGGNVGDLTSEQLRRYGLWRPMSYEPWHVELIGSR